MAHPPGTRCDPVALTPILARTRSITEVCAILDLSIHKIKRLPGVDSHKRPCSHAPLFPRRSRHPSVIPSRGVIDPPLPENAPSIRRLTGRASSILKCRARGTMTDVFEREQQLYISMDDAEKAGRRGFRHNDLLSGLSKVRLAPDQAVGGICTTRSNRSRASSSFRSRPTLYKTPFFLLTSMGNPVKGS